MLASTDADDVNLERVVSMLIIHDIVEVQVGDVPIYDHLARRDVALRERAAANQLFARLPEPDALGLLSLWEEFETDATRDAKYARVLDRLQPLLVHWAGDGAAWAERQVR